MAIGERVLKPINTSRWPGSEKEAEEEETKPVSPVARLFHSPQFNSFIVAVLGCKTTGNVELIKHGLTQTLIKHPRFSSKLVFDDKKQAKPTAWVRTKVNIDDHVIVPDLDPNMDSPDQFVEDYVSNITKTPMDFSKPLWEFHALNVKTSQAASTGVFRIHHSVGDGVSIISLLLACTRKSSDPDGFPSLPTPKKKKNGRPLLLRYLFAIFLGFKILWNSLVDIALFFATAMFLKDTHTPLKANPGAERNHKRFVHRVLSLDDIKLVKNALNSTTINDVLLGITQAGLSRYVNKKHCEAKGDEHTRKDKLLNHIRLRATTAVNLRANTEIKGLAKLMESGFKEGPEWGNVVGYILIPFHIAPRDDPLDYIRNAKSTVDRKKLSLEAKITNLCVKLLTKTIGIGAAVNLTYNVVSNTTICFSNVVGPVEEISFYGHPVAFIAPSVSGLPQALTIHFQSYVDKMILSLAVDEDVIPDPYKLCDDIEESLKLAKAACVCISPKPTSKGGIQRCFNC